MVERTMEFVMSQDAAHGALPTLRAATAIDAAPGSYYAPSLFGLKGDPVVVPVPKPAQDEAAAQRLWEASENLTRVQWAIQSRSWKALSRNRGPVRPRNFLKM
jgi:hypothetical protein